MSKYVNCRRDSHYGEADTTIIIFFKKERLVQ